MRSDRRVKQLGPYRPKGLKSALFVRSDQARVARHIGSEDRGEATGLAHVVSPIAKRRPDRKCSRSSGWRQGRSLGTI